MNIVFFAARQLHYDYFSKVSQQLKLRNTASTVLWHKSLWRAPLFLLHLAKLSAKDTRTAIASLIIDHIKEKQNSRKGRSRQSSYWSIFSTIKTLESYFLFAIYRHALQQANASHMAIWNGLKFRQRSAIAAADSLKIKTIYMENGLLPGMTTIDAQGINFLNSVPRDAQAFKDLAPIDLKPLNKDITKHFSKRPSRLPERYIFVPFQVNTDSQVVLFSPWIKDMFDLVEQFSAAADQLGNEMPNIVFKPHPACDQGYDNLRLRYQEHEKIHFASDIPTQVLIQHAKAVATINSTVGIESLLVEKKLIVLGNAFYNYPEAALDAGSFEALIEALRNINDWQPNHIFVQKLFNFLVNKYQLAGRWQDADLAHIENCATKLQELANG